MRNIFLCVLFFSAAAYAAPVGENNLNDTFTVKTLAATEAVLEGKAKDLKVGDNVYFPRSPFHFTVTAIAGEKITVALPERHDLSPSSTLWRKPTDLIKKNMDTESRLKRALED